MCRSTNTASQCRYDSAMRNFSSGWVLALGLVVAAPLAVSTGCAEKPGKKKEDKKDDDKKAEKSDDKKKDDKKAEKKE